MKFIFIFIVNIFLSHAFIDFKYKILHTNGKYSRLGNNKLKYTIPNIHTYSNIYKTINIQKNTIRFRSTNIQLSLESEFEEIKKKFIKNQNDNNKNDNNNNQNNNNINNENDGEDYNQENDIILYETTQLSLINNIIASEWAKKWIYDMVNFFDGSFPQYIYKDMFLMRDYCDNNYHKLDFYIAFFPVLRKCNDGPYYIAAFKLDPLKKNFSCKLIIQNPNYSDDDKSFLKDFKDNLKIMCKRAGASFNYSDLKKLENKRYYMVWKYDIDI